MKSEFEDILKSKLYEADIPGGYEADWEGFVAFREKTEKRRRKKIILIFSRSAAALFILSVSIVGLTRINYNKNQNNMLSRNPTILKEDVVGNSIVENKLSETILDAPPIEENTIGETSNINNLGISRPMLFSDNGIEFVNSFFDDESIPAEREAFVQKTGYSIGKLSLTDFSVKRKDQETGHYTDQLYDIDEYLRVFDNSFEKDDRDKDGWSTSLFANALAINANPDVETTSFNGIDGIPVLSAEKLTSISGYSNFSTENKSALIPYGTGYYRDYLSHQPPFILSASVSHGIFTRINLSSGLVYSFLRSEYTEYSSFNSYSQKLHYIGIPVSISYDFLPDRSRYIFYSVGGVLFEKAVSAIGVTKVFNGPELELFEKTSLITPKIMLSGNLGLGIGYNVIDSFSLYLESYLSYYFYTKGQPVSYRTANDFSLNMKIGLNYKF